MHLTSLETFLAIVDTGSLVRAADHLHVSQSTVTTRLQTLEQELGTTLVHRQRSGIELTEAGRRFHHHAVVMVELWSQATQDVALPDTVDVVCSIGCHPDLWSGPGRRLFDHIRTEHPDAALTVLEKRGRPENVEALWPLLGNADRHDPVLRTLGRISGVALLARQRSSSLSWTRSVSTPARRSRACWGPRHSRTRSSARQRTRC